MVYDELYNRECDYNKSIFSNVHYQDYRINQLCDVNFEELNKNYNNFNNWKGFNVYDIFSIIPKKGSCIILPFVYIQFYKNNVYLDDEKIVNNAFANIKLDFPFIDGHRIKICKFVDSNYHLFIFLDNLNYSSEHVFKYNDTNVYNYLKPDKSCKKKVNYWSLFIDSIIIPFILFWIIFGLFILLVSVKLF
jgi:hypothetical protein